MIQIITHCDRCNKLLDREEGHALQMWAKRPKQVTVGDNIGYVNEQPFHADICDGCRSMMDFFFVGKFKEEVTNA